MTITKEAEKIVAGARQGDYGTPERSLEDIAKIWSVIFKKEITKEQVALCMVGLKVARECANHKTDNLVDIIGYTIILDEFYENEN